MKNEPHDPSDLQLVQRQVNGLVKHDPTCRQFVMDTQGQLEVAVRCLGWRVVVSGANGSFRVHVTTDLGHEITETGFSYFGCILNAFFANEVDHHYREAVQHRSSKG